MLLALLGLFAMKGTGYALNTQSNKRNVNKYGVYTDGNGHYRLQKNSKKVIDTYDDNGDYIIKYVSNGLTVINITKNEAEERKQVAIDNGKQFYLRQISNGWHPKLGDYNINGDRYCKVNNPNKYYVKRIINYNNYVGDFYMDMNCNLICPTDEQLKKDEHYVNNNNELYNNIINEWNRYISKPYTDVKYNNCINLNKKKKRDYKIYTDKINKW